MQLVRDAICIPFYNENNDMTESFNGFFGLTDLREASLVFLAHFLYKKDPTVFA
jgi:hypothetical protein